VISGLEKLDPVREDFVDEAIGFVDAPRPHISPKVLQGLGFSDSSERFPEDSLHQVQHAQCGLAAGVHPEAKILQAFVLEDGAA